MNTTPRLKDRGPRTPRECHAELAAIIGKRWQRNLAGLEATHVRTQGDAIALGHYGATLVEATPDRVVVRPYSSVSSAARVRRFSPVNVKSDSAFGGWRFKYRGTEYWTPRGTIEIVEADAATDGRIVRGAIDREIARKLGRNGREAFRVAVYGAVKDRELKSWQALEDTDAIALAVLGLNAAARELVAPLMANGIGTVDAIDCARAIAA